MTKKEIEESVNVFIRSDIHSFYYAYIFKGVKFSVSTYLFSSKSDRITDEAGNLYGEINTKKEFINFIYKSHLSFHRFCLWQFSKFACIGNVCVGGREG